MPGITDRVCSPIVRTVEQMVEQIRAAVGADFAFVLTRKGRLVTHRAPRDMPEVGRMRLVRAARPLVGTDEVIEVTLPREELVPFGGAAPIDVYIGVVAEQAIVCLVMASWADKIRVAPALESGMRTIAPLLRRGVPSARRPPDVEPAKGSPYVSERASPSVPPPPDSAPVSAPFIDLRASLIPDVPRASPRIASLPSVPEISVSEAPLGRESLAAIRRDASAGGSAPDITVGESALGRESLAAIRRESGAGRSLPDITLGEAPLGRESLAAIELDGGGRPKISSSPEAIRVDLASMPDIEVTATGGRLTMPWVEPAQDKASARLTLPWVEPAPDAKRAADAARLGRKLAMPKVTIKLEDADALEAADGRPPAKRS